ncbi:MAG: hypothetical protein HONBIEJF_01178 [Fimbriimonadaceae bacterium]|nr:hypothetical protein [Fimbriimonadaceae bacterium]
MASQVIRPKFEVVGILMVALCAIGAAVLLLKSHIPPGPENGLAAEPGEYVRAGARQFIDWRPMRRESLQEARRLDRPIFLCVGTGWSRVGREADEEGFAFQDVVERINQRYLPIRIDANLQPRWLSAYLPLSRLEQPFDVGFQLYVLTPDGKLVDRMVRQNDRARFNGENILAFLRRAESLLTGSPSQALSTQQDQEVARLSTPGANIALNYQERLNFLLTVQAATDGAYSAPGFLKLQPEAWRLLWIGDRQDQVKRGIDAVATSAMVDWIDGGFRRMAVSSGWKVVDLDRVSILTADAMAAFGEASVRYDDPLYRKIARSVFDGLLSRRSGEDSSFYAYVSGDEKINRRSLSESWTPARIRDTFDPEDRERVRKYFGLRVEDNPQMLIKVADRTAWTMNADVVDGLLDRMRSGINKLSRPIPKELDLAAPNCFVTARLLETARTLGDSDRIAAAGSLYERLRDFRVGSDDIRRRRRAQVVEQPVLLDYLAFADAAMEEYLLFGRQDALSEGAAVLNRALKFFATPSGSALVEAVERDWMADCNTCTPQIADDVIASSSALAIRLAWRYGKLVGADFERFARSSVAHFSEIVARHRFDVSGFYFSAATVGSNRMAAVVGPNALGTARELSRLAPGWFVAPILGGLRPDLRARSAGIYLVGGEGILGPYDLKAAVSTIAGIR